MRLKILEFLLGLYKLIDFVKAQRSLSSGIATGAIALALWLMGTPVPNSELVWMYIALRASMELTAIIDSLNGIEKMLGELEDVHVSISSPRGLPLEVAIKEKPRAV